MPVVFAEHCVLLICETTVWDERCISVQVVGSVLLVSSPLLQPGFFTSRLKH